jgi:TM2 domain-containing membrane protein YozV
VQEQAEQELSWSQKRALDDAYDRNKKSMVAAYALAVFFGALGVHRLYLGRNRSGYLMLGLWLAGFILAVAASAGFQDTDVGLICDCTAGLMMISVWIWVVVDLFLIPAMLRTFNADLAEQLRKDITAGTPL